jgi:TonB family protein
MKSFLVVFFLFFSFIAASAQNSVPSPACGWDSLKSLIAYPDLAQRAGVEGRAVVTVGVFSNGEIRNISIETDKEIFREPIERAIQKTKWNPGTHRGYTTEAQVKFSIDFFIKGMREGLRLAIEAAQANKEH